MLLSLALAVFAVNTVTDFHSSERKTNANEQRHQSLEAITSNVEAASRSFPLDDSERRGLQGQISISSGIRFYPNP
jgi:hypothetical protein